MAKYWVGFYIIVLALMSGVKPCAAQSNGDATFLHDEAGIAAYTKILTPIDLDNIASHLVSVTYGFDYVQGVFANDVNNSVLFVHGVHVYAHQDGWMVAYYPTDALTSELFLIQGSNDVSGIYTTLKFVLFVVASTDGAIVRQVDYFDFRYPNAGSMLWVRTYRDSEFSLQFQNFEILEQSWAFAHHGNENEQITLLWDSESLSTRFTPGWNYDVLSTSDVQDGDIHTASVPSDTQNLRRAYGTFSFTYRRYGFSSFLLSGYNDFEQIPLRYPRELIKDITNPYPIHVDTNIISTTFLSYICHTIEVEFSELVQHDIHIYKFYLDSSVDYNLMRYSYAYGYRSFTPVQCSDCSHIIFVIEAYDMSDNPFNYQYEIKIQHPQHYHIYLPLIHRN